MIKSKRGRKPKNKCVDTDQEQDQEQQQQPHEDIQYKHLEKTPEPAPKKRGRKPKGGKIIENTPATDKIVATMPNIVMHLQCTIDDVYNTFNTGDTYDPTVFAVENYDDNRDFFKSNFTMIDGQSYKTDNDEQLNTNLTVDKTPANDIFVSTINKKRDSIHTFIDIEVETPVNQDIDRLNQDINEKIAAANNNISDLNDQSKCRNPSNQSVKDGDNTRTRGNSRLISQKLRELSHKLHNNVCDNKSACFWCTCRFNTTNIYIPKNIQQDRIDVYGCFCSPQCATSFLMKEDIDSSIKFERYSLINYIYGAIYEYSRNIKPAPDPHYTLDKFCGNLSIEEYRQQFTDDNVLMVANKPQSRIFPELFEENNMTSNDMRYSINKFT